MLRHKLMNAVIAVILVIVIFLGYKTFCYYKYNDSEFNDLAVVKFNGTMTINHVDLTEEEYLTYGNIKVKNIFEDYDIFDDESNALKYINKEDKGKAVFMGEDDQFLYILTSDEEYKDYFLKFSQRENVKDDLDLLKYFEAHRDDKVTFFMTRRKQKDIHTIKEVESLILPSLLDVKEVNGTYSGYIFKTTKNITEINLLLNNKRFYFTFIGDFSENDIQELMNTVVLN